MLCGSVYGQNVMIYDDLASRCPVVSIVMSSLELFVLVHGIKSCIRELYAEKLVGTDLVTSALVDCETSM